MDTAIPLGIIVNELISNALKHAFPSEREGEIKISFRKNETFAAKYGISGWITTVQMGRTGRIVQDCINDNFRYMLISSRQRERAFPKKLTFRNAESLGLQLVNILVEQMDGCIEL